MIELTKLFNHVIDILKDRSPIDESDLLLRLEDHRVSDRFIEFLTAAFPSLIHYVSDPDSQQPDASIQQADSGIQPNLKRRKLLSDVVSPTEVSKVSQAKVVSLSEIGHDISFFEDKLTELLGLLDLKFEADPTTEQIISRYFGTDTSAPDLQNLLEELKHEVATTLDTWTDWYVNQMQVYFEADRPKDSSPLDVAGMNPIVAETMRNFMNDQALELYSHQKQALDALQAGRDICISTSTASGKSLIFMAHALQRLLQEPGERILAIYPTKALAQDQLGKWRTFMSGNNIDVQVIDGDTPFQERKGLAGKANIVLTNLDYCHKTILPGMNSYTGLIKNLGFLIVDEAHVYRGVFGAHSALTLRRVLLMHDMIKNRPPDTNMQIITCTATLGNPEDHFRLLTGRENATTITSDGSPAPPKIFVLWDPPKFKAQALDRSLFSFREFFETVPSTETVASKPAPAIVKLNEPIEEPKFEVETQQEELKVSAINEAMRLFLFMVRKRVKTFLFCNARSLVESIFTAVRSKLTAEEKTQIVSYRGGYAREERRLIEQKIFRNEAYGVISTNALELGIDLGLLDVVITLGFEGSVSSVRQRLGRAGRSGTRPCLGILVAFDSPVERFVVKQLGNAFWKKPPEPITFDPSNVMLLKQHLVCAAKECPNLLTRETIISHFGQNGDEALNITLKTGEIRIRDGYLKFGVTSRFLMVSGAEDDYSRPVEFPEAAASKPGRQTGRAPKEAFPFLISQHREALPNRQAAPKSQAQEDLDHDLWLQQVREGVEMKFDQIAKSSETTLRQPKAVVKKTADERPLVSLNDLSGMKDAKKFVEPHGIVDLRSAGIPDVVVYSTSVGRGIPSGGFKRPLDEEVARLSPIDQINLVYAFMTVFPGAIIKIRGQEFKASIFNYNKRYAIVSPLKDCDYHTAASDRHSYILLAQEKLLNNSNQPVLSRNCDVYLGPLRIRWTVPKYYHIPKKGGRSSKITGVDLSLPDLAYDTRGLVLEMKQDAIHGFYAKARNAISAPREGQASEDEKLLQAAVHGIGHALCKASVTVIWCDLRDIGKASRRAISVG